MHYKRLLAHLQQSRTYSLKNEKTNKQFETIFYKYGRIKEINRIIAR